MRTPSVFRIRFGIVAVFSVLGVAFLLSPGRAQFGRPPSIPRPPNFRPPSMPRPGIIRPPSMPRPGAIRPPSIPHSPLFPPSIPHQGGLPGHRVYTWTCERCKASLGTTTTSIAPFTKCPHCGVNFTGTIINHDSNPTFRGNPPPSSAPKNPAKPSQPGESSAPPLPTNPNAGNAGIAAVTEENPGIQTPEPPVATPEDDSQPREEVAVAPKPKSRLFVFIIAGVILLFILGAVALGFVVIKISQPVKSRRKPRAYDLDDD